MVCSESIYSYYIHYVPWQLCNVLIFLSSNSSLSCQYFSQHRLFNSALLVHATALSSTSNAFQYSLSHSSNYDFIYWSKQNTILRFSLVMLFSPLLGGYIITQPTEVGTILSTKQVLFHRIKTSLKENKITRLNNFCWFLKIKINSESHQNLWTCYYYIL